MLFGVVDLARDPNGFIETAVAMYAADALCLFDSALPESIRRRAPYVIPLPRGSEFAQLWYEQGWGSAWGILVRSDRTALGLRNHLRRFLTVQMPDGEPALFRFYDPRVLPAYLRTCDGTELKLWFSGVDVFRVETSELGKYIDFTFDGHRLVER